MTVVNKNSESSYIDIRDIKIPEVRQSDFDEVYQSVKDSPEAVKELDAVKNDIIERMETLVEKYEALAHSNPADVTEDELFALGKEAYQIEEDRLNCIADILHREVARKEAQAAAQKAEIRRLAQIKYRLENNNRKIYPNDPCPCGSGKKYKKCCGRKQG